MKGIGFTLLILISLFSCSTVDLYEKSVTIPGHKWKSSFTPKFDFTIKDTSSLYQIYFIIRHDERYNFSNIYINLYASLPGQDTAVKIQRDLQLATQSGWTNAVAMDDIYEHRIKL